MRAVLYSPQPAHNLTCKGIYSDQLPLMTLVRLSYPRRNLSLVPGKVFPEIKKHLNDISYPTPNELSNFEPQHTWDPFDPFGNSSDTKNQRNFMNELAQQLNITDYNSWFSVSRKVIEDHGGAPLLEKYNWSRKKLLQTIYPEYLIIL